MVWYPCLEGVLLLQFAKPVCPPLGKGAHHAPQGSVPCQQKLCRTHRAGAGGKHACGDTFASVSPCREGWGWAFMGKPSVLPEHVSPTAGTLRSNLRLKKKNHRRQRYQQVPRDPQPHAACTSGASSCLLPTAQQCQAPLESGEGSTESCKPTPASSGCCIWGEL